MNAVDSSVAVAGIASWHSLHRTARLEIDRKPRIVGHCWLETFSVLTRLPASHRTPTDLVVMTLEDRFGGEQPLVLSTRAMASVVRELATLGIIGGAVYDGLIALTAAAHGATLLTLDQRASETYRRCGVDFRMVA